MCTGDLTSKDGFPLLVLNVFVHIVGPVAAILLQSVHMVARKPKSFRTVCHLTLHIRQVTLLATLRLRLGVGCGSSFPSGSALLLFFEFHLLLHPLWWWSIRASDWIMLLANKITWEMSNRPIDIRTELIHISRRYVLSAGDPLNICNGWTRWDESLWIEKLVIWRFPMEICQQLANRYRMANGASLRCGTSSPNVEQPYFGWSCPSQDISCRRNDGFWQALHFNDVANIAAANLLEGWNGECPSITVSKEPDKAVTSALSLHDCRRITQVVIPRFVSALGRCRLKHPTAWNRHREHNTMNFRAMPQSPNCIWSSESKIANFRIDRDNPYDLVIE